MKKILFLSLAVIVVNTIGYAQSDVAAETQKPDKENIKTPKPASDTKATAGNDVTVIYIGTTEFYLALEREGVLRG